MKTYSYLLKLSDCPCAEGIAPSNGHVDDRDEITAVTGNIINAVFATLGNLSIIR